MLNIRELQGLLEIMERRKKLEQGDAEFIQRIKDTIAYQTQVIADWELERANTSAPSADDDGGGL